MATSSTRSVFANCPLFASCSRRELAVLRRLGDVVEVGAGDVVLTPEHRLRWAIVVAAGTVTAGAATSLGPGATIGLVEALGHTDRRTAVVAETDATLFFLGARELNGLLDRLPGFAAGVARELARSAAAA